ncbi:MAG: efflux RND transporter periplasmic adaptor subunit [Planctomycetaceae bacterium]|nr:efflux RND transporter periplasmic adaptor subunit [Planctomycetaceae bacterium]
MRTGLSFFVAVAVVVGAALHYARPGIAPAPLRKTKISRGELLATINTAGTVQPEEVVDVGAQVVGQIKTLGIDPTDPAKKKSIDFGSIVNEGTVLALLDDSAYRAQVDNAEATLQRAQADLVQAQAKLDQAEEEWRRAKSLLPTQAIAKSEYDSVTANYRASLAQVASQKASVRQSEVMLRLAKTNLENTVIRSPVNGVILDRRASVGQTVVAAFNAPNLFLIAKDLRRMQVWASVSESEIGRIRKGMPVRFTVDNCPGEVFRGRVDQIRLKATTTGTAVTYTVVVVTDNSQRKLLPYLTANLQFEVGQTNNVLIVPNSALSWQPRPEQLPPELRETAAEDAAAKPANGREERRCLWVEAGKYVRPIPVRTGASNGAMTEVRGEQVKEGMEVVVGQTSSTTEVAAEPTDDPPGRLVNFVGGTHGIRRSRY